MKKNNLKKVGGLLLILMILTAGCDKKENEVITYNKESNEIVEKNSNKGEEKLEEEIVENSNSNEVISNSNSTNISNNNSNVSKKISYSISTSTVNNNKEVAIIRGKENGKVVWEYKTGTYEATELDNFKLYAGSTYVYVAEAGIVKALNKNTGKVVWKSSANVGRNTEMLELNGKLYAIGSYNKGLSILNVSNGKLDKEVSINPYIHPTNLKKVSNNILSFDVNGASEGTLQYNITTGKITKVGGTTVETIKVVGEKIGTENLVIVKGYDENNKLVWSYTTGSIYRIGSEGPEWYDGENTIYVNDKGELVALDKQTGKKLWTTNGYQGGGSMFSSAVEADGKLVIIESSEYQMIIIDIESGKIIKNLVSIFDYDPIYNKDQLSFIENERVVDRYFIYMDLVLMDLSDNEFEVTISFDIRDYSIDIVNQ